MTWKRPDVSPAGRYWPRVVHVEPPRLGDGSVDVRALLSGWDSDYNDRLPSTNAGSESATFALVDVGVPGAASTAPGPADNPPSGDVDMADGMPAPARSDKAER